MTKQRMMIRNFAEKVGGKRTEDDGWLFTMDQIEQFAEEWVAYTDIERHKEIKALEDFKVGLRLQTMTPEAQAEMRKRFGIKGE